MRKSVIVLVGLSLWVLTGCSSQPQTSASATSTEPVKSLYTANGVTVLEDMQTGDLIYETDKGVATVSSAMFSDHQIKNLVARGYVPVK